uniref:FAD-binding FR-type domain-containing protein n=1 Tax=Mesocestoides corti TaxID=53468 RepID=A0A5K3EZ40_MESCO
VPYEANFDLIVHREDRERALQVFLKLAADRESRMRIFDLSPANMTATVGLACARGTKWMKPETWKKLKRNMSFREGIPTGHKMTTYFKVMGSCETYVDIHASADTDVLLDGRGDQAPMYRPLEGTLFRVPDGERVFLELVAGSGLGMCLPRTQNVKHMSLHPLPDKCQHLSVSCSELDFLYPGLTEFTEENDTATYETCQRQSTHRCCKTKAKLTSAEDWPPKNVALFENSTSPDRILNF